MQRTLLAVIAFSAIAAAATALAAPEYKTIRMEIDVAKPAQEVWAKVGKYCAIATWMKVVPLAAPQDRARGRPPAAHP